MSAHKLWILVDTDYPYVNDKSFGGIDKIELFVSVGRSTKNSVQPIKIIIKRDGEYSVNVKVEKK